MVSATEDHKFNDDLLLLDADQNYAMQKYDPIFHVLYYPELQMLFSKYNDLADGAKKNSSFWGLIAIICGFSALAIAALEIYPWRDVMEKHWSDFERILTVLSGGFAITSFLIGSMGMLIAGRKRVWLQHRLMGERIRQFHFQTFVFRLREILKSLADDERAKVRFLSARERWFETFKMRFIGKLDAALFAVLQDEYESEIWLHEDGRHEITIIEAEALNSLFEAYRELRILHQLHYAEYKLHDDHKIFSKMPIRQVRTLSLLSLASITLLITSHAGILAGVIFWNAFWQGSNAHVVAAVVIIWIALGALATRAIGEGLQPEREVERYRQYRSTVRGILERYDSASTQTQKVEIMLEMERVAFEEMRNFLIAHERSRFVM